MRAWFFNGAENQTEIRNDLFLLTQLSSEKWSNKKTQIYKQRRVHYLGIRQTLSGTGSPEFNRYNCSGIQSVERLIAVKILLASIWCGVFCCLLVALKNMCAPTPAHCPWRTTAGYTQPQTIAAHRKQTWGFWRSYMGWQRLSSYTSCGHHPRPQFRRTASDRAGVCHHCCDFVGREKEIVSTK
jgi:hypothetical protein